MKIQGRVINDRNEYVPYATVTIVDATGKSLNAGVVADAEGYFQMDSPLIDANRIMVTAASHEPVTRDPGPIMVFTLPVKTLDEVIVTPHKNNWLLWAVLGYVAYKII